MLSYRKLAMRVLGRPLHTEGIDSPRPASQRAAALVLTAAMLTTLAAPAFADIWHIENGDITISAGESGNNVTQNNNTTYGDTNTIITNQNKDTASSHTVTIEAKDKDDKVEVTLKDVNIDASSRSEAAVSVTGKGDTTIELDGDNELKSGDYNAGLEKNGHESEGTLTIKDDKGKDGSLTAEGGFGGAGIGGGIESTGSNITIRGGTIEAVGGSNAAGIGDGAGAWSEIDPDAPPSNPNHIIISGDAEVEAKAGASTGGKTAAIGGGIVGEIPNDALSDDDHKVTGGSLTRYDPDGKKMEDYSYDRRTPSQPEQPDDTENSDDEDDAPDTQTGEVPDRVKQMYEAMGVITHLDGTQELGDVTTAEYDPVNKVLSFDAHGTVFRMTGDSLRELAKEVHELRIRFLDGNGQEMEAVIPLARIKDLVGVNGAFELELSQEGLYRFHVIRQTGYDRKTFSDETALRINGRELVLVYRVGDEEQKAQETARVEEAIARRKQEKKQWGTVLSGREGGSLSGLPGLTQPGTGTVGGVTDSIADQKVTDMGSITVRLPGKSAPDQTVWKTVTGNIVKFVSGKQDVTHDDSADIVKLVSGKQDDKQEDPAPSVGDLSGLQTLSPDSLTTAPQPETSAQQPETGAQQPETGTQQPEVRGWVKDSQGKWVWRSGQESAQQPDWKPNKWVRLHDYFPWDPFYDSAYWETRKWRRVSQPPDSAWWDPSYDSAWMYDYEG